MLYDTIFFGKKKVGQTCCGGSVKTNGSLGSKYSWGFGCGYCVSHISGSSVKKIESVLQENPCMLETVP